MTHSLKNSRRNFRPWELELCLLKSEESNWGLSEYKFLYSSNFSLNSSLNAYAVIEPTSRIISNYLETALNWMQRHTAEMHQRVWDGRYSIYRRRCSSLCIDQPLSSSKEMLVLLRIRGLIWSIFILRRLAFIIHYRFWIIATLLMLHQTIRLWEAPFCICSTPRSTLCKASRGTVLQKAFFTSHSDGSSPWSSRDPEF